MAADEPPACARPGPAAIEVADQAAAVPQACSLPLTGSPNSGSDGHGALDSRSSLTIRARSIRESWTWRDRHRRRHHQRPVGPHPSAGFRRRRWCHVRRRGQTLVAIHKWTFLLSAVAAVVTLPEAAWEASLGVWLVVKGFRPAPVSCDRRRSRWPVRASGGGGRDGAGRGRQHRLGRAEQVEQRGLGQGPDRGAALRAGGGQAAVAQAGQVAGDGGLGQPQRAGQVHHPGRPGGETAHDGQPGRVAEGPEQRGGGPQRRRHRHRHRRWYRPRGCSSLYHRHSTDDIGKSLMKMIMILARPDRR